MFGLDLDLGPIVFLFVSITCMIKIATHTTKLHATRISLYHCTYSTYHCTYRTSSLHIPYFLIAHTVLCHCTYRTSSLRISYVYCTAPFAYVGDLSPSHSSQAQVKIICILYHVYIKYRCITVRIARTCTYHCTYKTYRYTYRTSSLHISYVHCVAPFAYV